MKKNILIAVVTVLAMSLVACGGSSDNKKSTDATQNVNTGETSKEDSSEKDKDDSNVKVSEWGQAWVDPRASRIVINFPERSVTDGGGQLGYYNSGMATIVMCDDFSDKIDTNDVTKIISSDEEYWKHYMPCVVQISDIEKLEITSEETVEINGYNFYKMKGKFHFNGYFDEKYSADVIGYATYTKYEGNKPVYFFVWDGSRGVSTSRYVVESVADRIEETADNMAKSLCEYEGGADAYSDYMLYGLENLKVH